MNSTISRWTSPVWQMALMALQYLRGRKLRTALTTLAVVFGVGLIFTVNLVLPAAMDAFSHSVSVATGSVDMSFKSVSGEAFSTDMLQKVSAVDGVRAVTGVLSRNVLLPSIGAQGSVGSAPQIELIGLDPTTAADVRQPVMSEGRFLQPGDTGAAILPAGIADIAPQLKVGVAFPLITSGGLRIYTVVGLLANAQPSVGTGSTSAPEVIVPLGDAQSALNQPGMINSIEVSLIPGADHNTVASAIQMALGDNFMQDTSSAQSSFANAMQIGYLMFYMLGLLALFMGAFLIFNTFRTIVIERRHDLAMLRAIGAARRQVMELILVESLVQGIIGTLLGLVFGYLLASAGVNLFSKVFSQYGLAIQFHAQLTASAFVLPVVMGLLTTLLAGYLPARSAGKTSPLEGLRPSIESNVQKAARRGLIIGVVIMILSAAMVLGGGKTGAGGAIFFLIGMVVAAPGLVMPVAQALSPLLAIGFAREGDLARGNLVRQPGRAAVTASTLMIGLATLVLMAALVSSFTQFSIDLVNRNFTSDVLLMPGTIAAYDNVVGADPSLAQRIRALPEVKTVGTLRYATTTYQGQTMEVMGIDPVDYPQVSPLDFSAGNPSDAYAALGAGRNIIANALVAYSLNLQVGSDIVLQTAEGPQTYHVVGIGNDTLTLKVNAFFISQANLQADFHKAEDVILMASFKPGTDFQAGLAAIQHITADYPQFTAHLTGEYRATLVNTITGTLGIFYVLGLLILIPAALGMLNTLTINVMERTREIGVIRAVGGSRSQVRRMVTAEALLLGLFGAAAGVLAGVALSYGFVSAFSLIGWKVPFEFPLVGIIATIILGVLVALFASILPARNAAKLDIVRALQYE